MLSIGGEGKSSDSSSNGNGGGGGGASEIIILKVVSTISYKAIQTARGNFGKSTTLMLLGRKMN